MPMFGFFIAPVPRAVLALKKSFGEQVGGV